MSEAGESKTFKRFPMTIAQMGPWDFQAAIDSLGLADDDQAAGCSGDATLEQVARLQIVVQLARNELIGAVAGLPFGKPS